MPSSRKSAMIALAVALGATQAVAQQAGDKKGKENKPKAKPGTEAQPDDALDLPIPKGKPQKGVKVPIYGANGKLKMNWEIGVGTWIDEENVKLEKLRVETFKDDGTRDLDMDLPDAVFNRRTKVISSETKAVIRRQDFEVTGNTVAFNIETREGMLGGGVKMLIYDMGSTAKSEKATIEFEPKPEPTSTPPANKPPK